MTATLASPVHQLGVVDGIRRQVDYWRVVYQRTWRATVVSSFLAPLLYVVAMGVLLGGFIEGDPDVLEGATSYFDFVVPGLIAAHAMQTAVGETTFPVMGMIKWQRIYDSMLATPLGCRDLVAAHLSFVLFRLGVFPLFLFSGAFFPISNLGTVGEWVARCTPLWHGVNLSRMFALDNVTWWVAAVNIAVLAGLTVGGWFWAVRGLEGRLVS